MIGNLQKKEGIYINEKKNIPQKSKEKDPLKSKYYIGNLNKIYKVKVKENIENNLIEFKKNFIIMKQNTDNQIENIFKRNKPTLKKLSSIGTELDIDALLMNYVNPEQNIYLELNCNIYQKLQCFNYN